MSLLGSLFDPSGLTPHGFCLTWAPGLIWLHAGSDALITLAYLSIPISLVRLLQRRNDRAYHWITYPFVVFIIACALTHGLAILTLWVPAYGLEGLVKAATALASMVTAATLWITAPQLVALLSPLELTRLNAELMHTLAEQKAMLHNLDELQQSPRSATREAEELRISNARLLELSAAHLTVQKLLAESEAESLASFDAATVGKVHIEPPSGRLLRVNNAFADILGYEVKDLVGREIWDLTYPADRAAARAGFSKLLTCDIAIWAVEERLVRRDGVPVRVHISATVIIDHALGLPRVVIAEAEDLGHRQDLQAALRATEIRLSLALETAQAGIWEFDLRNNLCLADDRSSVATGGEVPAETWLSLNDPRYAAWVKRIHPDDRDRRQAALQSLFAGQVDMVQIEYRAIRAGGGWLYLSNRCAVVERDPVTGVPIRAVGVVTDVTKTTVMLIEARTARADLERDLQNRTAVLAHRHLLLREVYHRMNDNLRITDRLLATQARQLKDREARNALSTQRSRIFALGFVHAELMTAAEAETTFDIAPFLNELCDAIRANGPDIVSLHVEAGDLKVTLDYAIPFGLLVTELLTECLAHEPEAGSGRIWVSLQRGANAEVALMISHDGIGSADAPESASVMAGLETRLVKDLVSQLGAELRVNLDPCLKIGISMPDQPRDTVTRTVPVPPASVTGTGLADAH